MEHPLVTVIIPVYNRELTISRAINSVLQQTYKNIEVIVVDDCSSDSTAKIVEDYNDPRVKLIRLSHNCGANSARNRGISEAEGEFIAFQDSDDEWLEDKLDKQIKYMVDKDFDASFCPYILYDVEQSRIMPRDFQNTDLYTTQLKEKLKKGNVVGTPTLIVKKSIFPEIGMFNEEMGRLQDYEFAIRIVKKFRIGYLNKPLVKAYRTNNSISTNEKALLDAYKILMKAHSDFVDFGGVIECIFNSTSVFRGGRIDWDELEGFAEAVRNGQNPEKEKLWGKAVVEFIYTKYFLIEKMLEEWYGFFCSHIKDGDFAIYGAGTYGQKAYYDIKSKGCIPKCFFVSECGEEQELHGLPIVGLTNQIDKNIPVVVAVSWEKQGELIQRLLDLGMHRFCVYPFCQ